MDIVIIRDGDGYRLLHGHLRLANLLRGAGEASVPVPGEGEVRVVRVRDQYIIRGQGRQWPLRMQ